MKVKVSVKTSPKAQEKYYEQAIAEAYAEMEAMFQENKDLRVSEGHLRDDLARAQALIAELNDQISASEADAAFWKKAAAENAELAEQNIAQVAAWERSAHEHGERVREQSEAITRLEAQLVAMGKKNDELQRELAYWKSKAEEATAELVKYDVGHYQREIDEWQATANQLTEKCQKFQDERDKAWTALRGLQNVESELEYYRDIATHRKERIDKLMEQIHELETELAELNEDYDALVQTKREYGEEIDRLRKVVTNLQTNRFTYEEVIKMIMNHIVPSADQ